MGHQPIRLLWRGLEKSGADHAGPHFGQANEQPGRKFACSGATTRVEAARLQVAGFGAAGANGYPMPAIPEMGSVWQAWTDAYQLIFTGGDAQQAFKDAAEQIRTLIAG